MYSEYWNIYIRKYCKIRDEIRGLCLLKWGVSAGAKALTSGIGKRLIDEGIKPALDLYRFGTSKGAYVKYIGGGTEGFYKNYKFYKFLKKIFIAQETIYLNIYGPVIFSENISQPLPSILVS